MADGLNVSRLPAVVGCLVHGILYNVHHAHVVFVVRVGNGYGIVAFGKGFNQFVSVHLRLLRVADP
ncbi:hypothetical protein Barb7_01904 [Bacteroidales bacterium Barb7]|nr:hypothetical protein Barb7_01904 [Bacteroidales bacterium Barb7]